MLFNSFHFLIFFTVIGFLYFFIPYKYRWAMLLLASCYFYMAFIPIYILILFITITIDYFAGILIEGSEGKKKKLYLIASIISTCAVLFIFKYFNFFNDSVIAIAGYFGLAYRSAGLDIILPIGLSFHTFQSLSYVIEVYYGRFKAERNFGIYSLYVMFFPQLVAGPIERPQNLLHQFYEKHDFNYEDAVYGLRLMLWGLFKKAVIADRLAVMVGVVYQDVHAFGGLTLAASTVLFAFQIYCDFSGYTDIARGTARFMGFRLRENFKAPYFAESISEFWKRWHISLSTWFRDYVYIPLGGNRVREFRHYLNLMIVFLVSGFWHGANWTFVIWGGLHGLYSTATLLFKKLRLPAAAGRWFENRNLLRKIAKRSLVFFLVTIAWVFFRAKSLPEAAYIIERIFTDGQSFAQFGGYMLDANFGQLINALFPAAVLLDVVLAIFSIALLLLFDTLNEKFDVLASISRKPGYVRWSYYYFLLLMIIFFGIFNNSQFIYFQF